MCPAGDFPSPFGEGVGGEAFSLKNSRILIVVV